MNDQPKSKKRGCLYGCLTVFILMLVAVIVAVFAIRHWVRRAIAIYTDTSPVVLSQTQMSAAEVQDVRQRYTDFFNGLKAKKEISPLVLTADDINALIASTGTNGLKGKLYISIEGDRIKGQVSVPLEGLPVTGFKGRYLNGTALFKIAIRDRQLDVRAESVEVRGSPVPQSVMKGLGQQNLAQSAMRDKNAAAMVQELENIVVTNGTVVLKPRQAK